MIVTGHQGNGVHLGIGSGQQLIAVDRIGRGAERLLFLNDPAFGQAFFLEPGRHLSGFRYPIHRAGLTAGNHIVMVEKDGPACHKGTDSCFTSPLWESEELSEFSLEILNAMSGGFLPSLFLPGGPVAGAAVGLGLSIASKSDKFMNTVFGEKDEDGRMQTVFQKGPIFANLILADEINRATPKTQSAMLEVMQEHKVTIANETYKMAEPFFVLATENPIEQDGTYPLPEAQMDRFIFKLIMEFPTVEELANIVKMTQITMDETAKPVVDGQTILMMRETAKEVPVIDDVLNYAMNLVAATHPELPNANPIAKKYVKYGASPRAGQALITAAKIRALMRGNFNVSYEDINALAYPVLRHRIKINYNAVNDHLNVEDVIGLLIKETK